MRTEEAVRRYLEHARRRGLAVKTSGNYAWALGKLVDTFSDLPTEPLVLAEYVGDLQLSPESRYDVWRITRRLYKWLDRWDLAADTMGPVDAPRRRRRLPRVLEDSEIVRLVERTRSRRERAMVAVILDTGIRLGELAGLRWQDIKLGSIHVDGKTGERVVPFSPNVRRLLVGLGDGSSIWTGRKGPLTTSGVAQCVRRTLSDAGYAPPRAGAHMLRHTFGRSYIMAGGDVFSLQRIMGHRDVSTTMIDTHVLNRGGRGVRSPWDQMP